MLETRNGHKVYKGLDHLPDPMKELVMSEDSLQKVLSDKSKLDKIIKSIKEGKESWNKENEYHVTELLGCLTKAYLMRRPPDGITKKELEPSFQTLYYFFRGNIFDMVFSLAMPYSQVDFNIPVENENNYDLSIIGRADWLDLENGTVVAVNDLKTVKNLYYIEKEGLRQDNLAQVLIYAWVFGAKKTRLYYLDFGDLIVHEVAVEKFKAEQDSVMKQLKERAMDLYEHILMNDPFDPEIDWRSKEDGWRCHPDRCPFTRVCHPGHPALPENNRAA